MYPPAVDLPMAETTIPVTASHAAHRRPGERARTSAHAASATPGNSSDPMRPGVVSAADHSAACDRCTAKT